MEIIIIHFIYKNYLRAFFDRIWRISMACLHGFGQKKRFNGLLPKTRYHSISKIQVLHLISIFSFEAKFSRKFGAYGLWQGLALLNRLLLHEYDG